MERLYGGIEAGGTKFVVAVSNADCEIVGQREITTGQPDETLGQVIAFFRSFQGVSAVSIGSFGPLDLDPASPTYGYITNTPKPAWGNTDIRGIIKAALNVPVGIESDAGCAAVGEYNFGPWKGKPSLLYITIGTGIGGAMLVDGRLAHHKSHPEMGHMIIPHDLRIDPFLGICPFHGDCWEGLASGPAIAQRAGQRAEHVIDPVRWDLEAAYIALALVNLVYTLRPQLVILGGGVIKHGGLIDEVRRKATRFMNGYLKMPDIELASENNAVKGALKLATRQNT